MKKRTLLMIDAIINLVLGLLLLVFPAVLVSFLGIPSSANRFYPSILGAVLVGIGVALLQETRNDDSRRAVGLGLAGAVSINLCAGCALAVWLLVGGLNLPYRGAVFLWLLVALLIGISSAELIAAARQRSRDRLSNPPCS
jgi:hypothetical protein